MTDEVLNRAISIKQNIDTLKNLEAEFHRMVNMQHDGTPVISLKLTGEYMQAGCLGMEASNAIWDFQKQVIKERIAQLQFQLSEL